MTLRSLLKTYTTVCLRANWKLLLNFLRRARGAVTVWSRYKCIIWPVQAPHDPDELSYSLLIDPRDPRVRPRMTLVGKRAAMSPYCSSSLSKCPFFWQNSTFGPQVSPLIRSK